MIRHAFAIVPIAPDSVVLLTPENQERIRVGKVVGRKTYIYVDAIGTGSEIDTSLADRLAATEVLAGVRRGEDFDLVRVDAATGEIALLNYPGFFDGVAT